ncbi:hypothetical protein STXM2123_4822 [Streptomyces sp. F-3]|nr:hypothetical protein STXM2123_4822 [Streptomyces sp. F-3]
MPCPGFPARTGMGPVTGCTPSGRLPAGRTVVGQRVPDGAGRTGASDGNARARRAPDGERHRTSRTAGRADHVVHPGKAASAPLALPLFTPSARTVG